MIARILASLLAAALEAAAILCWFHPEVFNADPGVAWQLHIVAASFFSLVAAISFSGATKILGRLLFWCILFLFAALVPGAGLAAAIALVMILSSRPRIHPEDAFSLEAPLDRLRDSTPENIYMLLQSPLVESLKTRPVEEIRKLMLGLRDLRDPRATAILKVCQQHPDHQVQLFSKGVWSDRIEVLEGHLEKLQQPGKDQSIHENRAAIAQVYLELARIRLLPDEEIKTACLDGIAACDEGLADSPESTRLLALKTRFLLMLGLPDQAGGVFRKLKRLPFPADALAALKLEILYQSGDLRECAEAFSKHRALPGALGEAQRFWVAPVAHDALASP